MEGAFVPDCVRRRPSLQNVGGVPVVWLTTVCVLDPLLGARLEVPANEALAKYVPSRVNVRVVVATPLALVVPVVVDPSIVKLTV
jgi:hypothetical protein